MPAGARQLFGKFQADRGPQLAAMIAYYSLLSFVPLMFIAFSVLGFFGQANEQSSLVRKLGHIFPDASLPTIAKTVNDIKAHSTLLGVIGLIVLFWSALALFGALETAFNIVYERPNRPFLAGKMHSITLLLALLVLFAGLAIGSFGYGQLARVVPGIAGNPFSGYVLPIVVSALGVFGFLLTAYFFLTNVEHTLRDVLPGALVATGVLELTFQVLPIYLRLSRGSTAQQAFGAPVLLLVWLYLMANVIVFGAEFNWWRAQQRELELEDVPGLA